MSWWSNWFRPKPSPPPPPSKPAARDFGFSFPECGDPSIDLAKYYSTMRSLGATRVRIGEEWALVEPQKGVFNWTVINRYKLAAQMANQYGLKVLMCIGNHRPYWNPTAAEFGVHAGQVASVFTGLATSFEIWNEPNEQHFWGNPSFPRLPSISEYADHLNAAYRAIKAVIPTAVVYSGGYMAAHGAEGQGTIDPLTFEQGLYRLSASRDGVCNHPYPLNNWFQIERPTASQYFIKTHRDIRALMNTTGRGSQPLIASELGIPSDIGEATQAQWLSDALSLVDGPIYLYALRDYQDAYGLFRSDWSPKPAVDVVKQWSGA